MIFLGSDHAGFRLKARVAEYLHRRGIRFADLGAYSEEPVDYPDIAFKVARKVRAAKAKGILICGAGVGICIAANRIKGIRAGLCTDIYAARMSRRDDDANILCLRGRNFNYSKALRIVNVFLSTRFYGASRHRRRIRKLG